MREGWNPAAAGAFDEDGSPYGAGASPFGTAAEAGCPVPPCPALERCGEWILRRFGESLAEDLKARFYDGELAWCFDVPDYTEDSMALRDVRFSRSMSFWRLGRNSFLADAEAVLTADIATDSVRGLRSIPLCLTLLLSFGRRLSCAIESIGLTKPDRDGVRLDEYLIPIMSYEEVENVAEEMLLTYQPEALRDRRAIDAAGMAEKMGLRIETRRLADMPRTKSILFWKAGRIRVTDSSGTAIEEAPVPADTIVLNANLVDGDNREVQIFHECFHAEYHRLFYRLQQAHSSDLNTVRAKRGKRRPQRDAKNPLPILEWEARQGSRALMMPRLLIHPLLLQYGEEERHRTRHAGEALENVGIRIAAEWSLPRYLVRARMIHLGFWQAQGCLNYVRRSGAQGGYIRPFLFDRDSCPGTKHTFVIQPADEMRLYENNPDYRSRIDTGQYAYAEGHVCLNDPKYILQESGGPRLTGWANRHVDQCCLRFENVYEVDDHYEFRLSRINSDEEYNRHYIDFIARGDALTETEISSRQSALIAQLPHAPGAALKRLMELNGFTQEKMAERALVSQSTVRRWCTEEYSFDAETALRIIVALSLPPWLSGWLLDTAKVPLQYHGVHLVYRNIINCRFMDTMETVNCYIQDCGYDKLREA